MSSCNVLIVRPYSDPDGRFSIVFEKCRQELLLTGFPVAGPIDDRLVGQKVREYDSAVVLGFCQNGDVETVLPTLRVYSGRPVVLVVFGSGKIAFDEKSKDARLSRLVAWGRISNPERVVCQRVRDLYLCQRGGEEDVFALGCRVSLAQLVGPLYSRVPVGGW